MKTRKRTTKKRSRQVAVYQGPPSPEEIDRIRREHRAIVMAGYSMLPKAIKIGAWFLDCRVKGRIKHGDWGAWMKSTFPDMGHTQLETYVRLAKHRQFLEAKFPEITSGSGETSADFQRFISLKEADHAIRNERMRAKEERAASIDVDATVTQVNGDSHGDTVKPAAEEQEEEAEKPLFGERGVKMPTAGVLAEPVEVLQEKARDYVGYLALAKACREDVIEWIKTARLSEAEVQHAIELACIDHQDFETDVRQHLLPDLIPT